MQPKTSHLTPEDVDRRVAKIEAMRGDDEAAHAEEDKLRRDVLAAIADGSSASRELAARALQTEDIAFARWYA